MLREDNLVTSCGRKTTHSEHGRLGTTDKLSEAGKDCFLLHHLLNALYEGLWLAFAEFLSFPCK